MQSNPFDQFDALGDNPFDGPMIIQPNARRIEEEERRRARQEAAERRANEAAMRAANADARAADAALRSSQPQAPSGYRFTANGGLEAIPGGPADKTMRGGGSNKTMRQGDADKLESQVDIYGRLKYAKDNFQPDYGGNLFGGMENSLQGMFNIGTPGQRDWWASFRAADNQIRNELFGASLTEGEKAAYNATTITESMRPEEINRNLATREEIVRKALQRRAGRIVAGGFNEDEVRAGLGDYADDILSQESVANQPNAVNPNNPLGGVRANGVHQLADTTQSQLVGQSEGGWFADPTLADVGPIVKRMLQNNRSAAEINAYVDGRYQASGAVKMNAEQRAQIAGLVAARRRNPSIPAGQLATDWGNFGMVQRAANPNGPTLGEQFAKSPAGAFSISAGNAASAGLLDEMAGVVGGEGAQQRMQAVKDQSRAENWKSAMAGDIAGGTLAMVGLNRAIGAAGQGGAKLAQWGGGIAPDIAYGAAYGAGESNDNRAMGAVTGGASAAAGNIVGRGVTGMFGRGIRGVSDPAVRYLNDRNIPLTVGQILGNRGIAGRTFSKMESVPVLGDVFNSRRMDGIKAFNRAAHEDALKPIGATIEGEAGQEAIDQAQQAVSAAYGDALNGVRVQADSQFVDDIAPQLSAGRQIPTTGDEFGWVMDNKIGPMFDDAGEMTGETMQAALQNLRGAAREFGKGGAMGNAAAQATRNVENSLLDLVERQAPGTVPALHAANNTYRNVSMLEDASLAARNSQAGSGIFTPAQLGTAMKSNTRHYGGKKAAARGDMPFNQLQQYGQEVLPSTVPNSGTADRGLAAYALPTVLGGSAAGLETFTDAPPQATVPLALLAALSTKGGSGAAQRLMVNRPDTMRRAGEALYGRRRLGGMFGAGFSAPLAVSFGIGSE